ncbi:hypothetical protein [Marinimicrobium agarilyticum]|uniref:hypothetical protein n=1 Tax=Marinimicrobium agarilyticum TaxID=306546 RepID=UPI000413FBCE|nr:hypothetical protein [Marinimicrobium agarilyticum]
MKNLRSLLHRTVPSLAFLLVFSPAMAFSEEGDDSNIYENCSSGELASIAKVWGFLKYYHPGFRRGKLDVDEFLFEGLNQICREASEGVSSYFDKFVQRYSVYERVNTASGLEQLLSLGGESGQRLQADLETSQIPQWIYDDPNITLSARKSLLEVFGYSRESNSFYNQIDQSTHMSNFGNESHYPNQGLTVELRILSLFRVWNAVEYYFPYKESIPGGWGGVLREVVFDFVSANSDALYIKAMQRLLVRMEDGHAAISEDENDLSRKIFGDKLAPVMVTYVDGKFWVKAVLRTASGAREELAVGDSIQSVGGKSVTDIKRYLEQYASSSNQHFKNQVIAKYLTISNKDNVSLEVERNGETLKLTVETVDRSDHHRMQKSWAARSHGQVFNKGATLYLHLNAFSDVDYRKSFDQYQNIIMDLRGYPWEADNADVMKYFLDQGVPFAAIRFPSSTRPGSFSTETIARTLLKKEGSFEGSLFVLVDHNTLSASDVVVQT